MHSSPYSDVQVAEPNREYAREMLSNIGGEASEMSAVGLYIYNHIIMHEQPEISSLFRRMSLDEMRHLELFSRAALKLGADPRLWEPRGRKNVYWTPKYIPYSPKPKRLLAKALYEEYMAIEKYSRQAKAIKDPGIVEILNRVLQDEREHAKALKELLLRQ